MPDNQFKVGDWVEFARPNIVENGSFTVGKKYQVIELRPGMIRVRNDNGRVVSKFSNKFIPWVPKVGEMVKLKKWENIPENPVPMFVEFMEQYVGQIHPIQHIDPHNVRVKWWDWLNGVGYEPANVEQDKPVEAAAPGAEGEGAIIPAPERPFQVGDMVTIIDNPDTDEFHVAQAFDPFIGDGVPRKITEVYPRGRWAGKCFQLEGIEDWWIHKDGIQLVQDGLQKPLEAPVIGFNEKVKAMVLAKKKAAQKPVKRVHKTKRVYTEAQQKGIEKAIARLNKDYQYSCALYSFVQEDGDPIHRPNTACHAAMGYPYNGSRKPIAMIDHIRQIVEHKFPKEDIKTFRSFTSYMLKRSPFKDAFLTKTIKEAWERGVMVDVDQPLDLITTACIALRVAHEHAGRIQVWKWCREKKYDELTAHFMMSCTKIVKGKFVGNADNAHHWVDGTMSFDRLVYNMVNGFVPMNERKTKRIGDGRYEVKHLAHNNAGNIPAGTSLKQTLLEMQPIKGGGFGDFWGDGGGSWTEDEFTNLCNKVQERLKAAKRN